MLARGKRRGNGREKQGPRPKSEASVDKLWISVNYMAITCELHCDYLVDKFGEK